MKRIEVTKIHSSELAMVARNPWRGVGTEVADIPTVMLLSAP